MIPFDIPSAIAGIPIKTRAGLSVIFAGYNPDAPEYCQVLGWVEGHADSWNAAGMWSREETDHDIFLEPKLDY